MIHTRKTRIGIIGMGHFIYWPQFDGLLDELKQKQVELAGYFSEDSEVIDLGFVDDVDSSMICLKKALASDLDALFIMMSTYITSQVLFPFAKYLHVPQILVGLQPLERLDYSKTTTYMQLCNDDICSMPEFAGVYERLGAPKPYFIVETAGNRERIAARIGEYERAISAVSAFKYAKFGYLGHTYDGMYDMNTDPTAFAGTFGAHVKMLEMCELVEYVNGATEAEVKARIDDIKSIFDIREPSNDPLTDYVHDEDLELAARCSVGLDRLVENNGLTALAYFYKGEHGNEYERIASNLIIGNSLLTSRNIPLAGEADLKTAAAMLIMNRVGGGGSFAELHPFDVCDDIVLIGHDGPHNINISNEKPVLRKLKKFHGKSGAGVSVEFKLKTGPISLLSCSVGGDGAFKLISAKGESMPGAIPATGNTNTKCKFDVSCTEFVERWCEAGPTHHLALGIGDHTKEIELFARMMNIKLCKVL
ncbi:MAG: L-fucose/L-arabinose isomerase family protein [Clostridia bacterium]|nr:L-fucose/L-arabinose isomerase family protein [Clostridia bacterium]